MNPPIDEPTMFNSGVEVANLLVSSGLLDHSWDAIDKLQKETPTPPSLLPIKIEVFQSPIGGKIITFIPSPPCTPQYLQTQGRDLLVSSDSLARENFSLFKFVSTKENPTFSLHSAAVTLFRSLLDKLSPLKTQYEENRKLAKENKEIRVPRLIVTGHSLGGSVAALFTLWLLETISSTDKGRPLCITFGSPLIGDSGLQKSISERPTWNSCFLHVASYKDPIPKLFACIDQSDYKPFGTFLLCSESGFGCFEESESTLDLMEAMRSDGGTQMFCYGELLKKFKCGVICSKGVLEREGKDFTPLQMGIFIQIAPVNVEATQRQLENGDINSLITKIEKGTKKLAAHKRSGFNPDKELNEMKINMAYIEWYKKISVPRGGYYDLFKTETHRRREEIVKRKSFLRKYWVELVKEAERRPQEEGKNFRIRCLYGGNNYRRLVEPIEIAEFYRKGNQRDYINQRSDHYKLLEKWMELDKLKSNQGNAEERTRACSLTEDSCFWAHVEEATISCKLLKNGETSPELKESLREDLVKFEGYVMDLVRKYAVSTEIFLNQSSFMQWWEDYKKIKVNVNCSFLSDGSFLFEATFQGPKDQLKHTFP